MPVWMREAEARQREPSADVIIGDRSILIDFTPKGGPRDFQGVATKEGMRQGKNQFYVWRTTLRISLYIRTYECY